MGLEKKSLPMCLHWSDFLRKWFWSTSVLLSIFHFGGNDQPKALHLLGHAFYHPKLKQKNQIGGGNLWNKYNLIDKYQEISWGRWNYSIRVTQLEVELGGSESRSSQLQAPNTFSTTDLQRWLTQILFPKSVMSLQELIRLKSVSQRQEGQSI